MFTRRHAIQFSVIALGLTFLVTDANLLAAGGGNRIRRIANMSAGPVKGKAKYEEINNNSRRKFSFELQKGTPGTVITIITGSNTLGTATVNAARRVNFELDTRNGQNAPQLPAGTAVKIKVNGTILMSGILQ